MQFNSLSVDYIFKWIILEKLTFSKFAKHRSSMVFVVWFGAIIILKKFNLTSLKYLQNLQILYCTSHSKQCFVPQWLSPWKHGLGILASSLSLLLRHMCCQSKSMVCVYVCVCVSVCPCVFLIVSIWVITFEVVGMETSFLVHLDNIQVKCEYQCYWFKVTQ